MNILHSWWPGGLIIGGLLAFGITKFMGLDGSVSASAVTLGWRIKLATVAIPAIAFAIMIIGQEFPKTERIKAGISNREMFRETISPMFLFLWLLMWMTASTEIGPGQWLGSVMTNLTGIQGILVLVYTAGVVFLFRMFGSGLAHRLSPFGLLAIASALSAAGLYGLAESRTALGAFTAATVFGAGTTYFWPVMLGITSEQFPKSGPLALAIMGGTGNLAIAFILPIMGGWYDRHGAAVAFEYVAVLPVILTVAFGFLFIRFRQSGGYKPVVLQTERDLPVEISSH